MEIKYKLTEIKKLAKIKNDFYKVLAHGEFNTNSKLFFIANDDLQIINVDEGVIEIIDDNDKDYCQMNELNHGKDFFVHNSFSKKLGSFKNHSELTNNDIWTRSKLSSFFNENNYKIPKGYKETVLNTKYKLNLIEGFLMFANVYLNNKNTSDYQEGMYFYEVNTFEEIIERKFQADMKITTLETNNYNDLLANFISKYLFEQKKGELKSIKICNQLFKLIDSIFIKDIENIYQIKTFYDLVFAVEYDSKFYCLNKTWSS